MEIKDYLKNKNVKITKARINILKVLDETDEYLTANIIWDKLRKSNINIDLSTVYRNLEVLVDIEVLEKFNIEENTSTYKIKKEGHKHNIECEVCHKITEIECPMPQLREYIKLKTGIEIIGECVNFKKGICKECLQKKANY